MSMETYKKSLFLNDLYSKLAASEEDLKNGKVSDVDMAVADIKEKRRKKL